MNSVAVPMPPIRPAWRRRLIDAPLARIVIFILVTVALFALVSGIVYLLGWLGKDVPRPQKIAGYLLRQLVPTLGAYLFIVLAIERRRPDELAWRKLLPHGAAGLLGGAALLATVIGTLWLMGAYSVTGVHPEVNWAAGLLVVGLGTGIAEEIVFRGVLFRITDEWLGMWPALAISALFFGGVHIGNPGATWWTSFAIAVEAGVLLGVIYHVTRSLPVCIGVHMAWNFTEGTIFGSAVSGIQPKERLLAAEFTGPQWLTGGGFGIEGSVVTVLLSLLASVALLAAQRRRTEQNATNDCGAAPC